MFGFSLVNQIETAIITKKKWESEVHLQMAQQLLIRTGKSLTSFIEKEYIRVKNADTIENTVVKPIQSRCLEICILLSELFTLERKYLSSYRD